MQDTALGLPLLTSSCVDAELISSAQEVVDRLVNAGKTVVTAESCTGGLVCTVLSEADGAGDILHGGFVTYSKDAKAAVLGLPMDLLESQGSVNTEVARLMVEGALRHSKADIALAVTGVLGPKPDEDGNPIGVVFFAYGRRGGPIEAVGHRFPPEEHNRLRRRTVETALGCIEKALAIP